MNKEKRASNLNNTRQIHLVSSIEDYQKHQIIDIGFISLN